ncbi:unnamed protein product [Pleuronectes platessa]|uniref:Uncharacterized protein n=1 Tax=Pleuronectes platessa TaxID=8262 RepID=A0A9N7YMG2_PLEPL|nr:unnamed protein product [Pleuronectes platessa]
MLSRIYHNHKNLKADDYLGTTAFNSSPPLGVLLLVRSEAHRAQRGFGDVLAGLRTTARSTQKLLVAGRGNLKLERTQI